MTRNTIATELFDIVEELPQGRRRSRVRIAALIMCGQWRPPQDPQAGYRCLGQFAYRGLTLWREIEWHEARQAWIDRATEIRCDPDNFAPMPVTAS